MKDPQIVGITCYTVPSSKQKAFQQDQEINQDLKAIQALILYNNVCF